MPKPKTRIHCHDSLNLLGLLLDYRWKLLVIRNILQVDLVEIIRPFSTNKRLMTGSGQEF